MSNTTDSTIVDAINTLIQEVLPTINQDLPVLIKYDGYDPLPAVTSGSYSPGSVNLGFCKGTVTVSEAITNLTGLSSMQVDSLTVDSTSGSLSSFTATGTMAVHLTQDLSADWSGKATASCGPVSKSQSLNGAASATGLTASANASLTGGVSGTGDITMESLQLTSFDMSYAQVSATVSGLGWLNPLLNDVIQGLSDIFGGWIKSELSGIAMQQINHELGHLFPFHFKP